MQQEQILSESQIYQFGGETADVHSSVFAFVLKYQLVDCPCELIGMAYLCQIFSKNTLARYQIFASPPFQYKFKWLIETM